VAADGQAPDFAKHRELFLPDSAQAIETAVARTLAEGATYELELEFLRADGSRGWMQARGEPVRDAEGRVSGIHGVAADITERKLARLQVEQLNRLYAALSECNWAIVHCADADELLERVCDVMVRHGGIDTAWIGRIDPASGEVTVAYARGEGAAAVAGVPVSVDPGESSGRGPIGTAVRELRSVWIDDLARDPLAARWLPAAERQGWRSAAFLPLLRDRAPFAVLTLFSTLPRWGDHDTRQLVEQISSNVNFAIDKLGIESEARSFRQQQHDAEERFRMLVDASRAGAFILRDGVIRYANARAGELLGLPGPEALVGRRLDDIAEPSHRAVISQALADLTQGRTKVINRVIHAVRPEGRPVAIVINATLASDGDQSPVLGLIEEADPAARVN
jgi:PAS domain S-box-containing protein